MSGSSNEVLVDLRGISKTYGQVTAVYPLDLQLHRGEFVAILGPSGCGKTTLLQMIGGFLSPSTGSIEIGGRDVTAIGADRRPTNMVFQGYGLFPHMTVEQNIAYGLRIAKITSTEIEKRLNDAIELVHLEQFRYRNIDELSGGQQQRVALARALIMRPEVLLLDEPLAALDLKLRKAMQQELRRVHSSTGGTFVFVTHDQEEAMALASRVFVMEKGRLIQQGLPKEIYEAPKTKFVATFIGEANLLQGRREDNCVTLDVGASFQDDGVDQPIVSIIRPEKMVLAASSDDPSLVGFDGTLTGTLVDAVFLGPVIRYMVEIDAGDVLLVDSRNSVAAADVRAGDNVVVAWNLTDQKVLPDE